MSREINVKPPRRDGLVITQFAVSCVTLTLVLCGTILMICLMAKAGGF